MGSPAASGRVITNSLPIPGPSLCAAVNDYSMKINGSIPVEYQAPPKHDLLQDGRPVSSPTGPLDPDAEVFRSPARKG